MSAAEIAAEIASSPEMQSALMNIGDQIALDASLAADDLVGARHKVPAEFGVEAKTAAKTARVHIWAKNGAAIHAERKAQVLVNAADKAAEKFAGGQ